MNLEAKILNQYRKQGATFGQLPYTAFAHYVCCEREKQYKRLLSRHFSHLNHCRVLEIGAGSGDNLLLLNRMGVLRDNLFANEMVEERLEWLGRNFSPQNIFPGNILHADIPQQFDIILQSTVFSSIPAEEDRMAIAGKMKKLLAPRGVILWYDFVYDNPRNPEVKKVTRAQVKKYFSGARSITFKSVTLLPPLARRVGGAYPFFNTLLPFLRTHVVALVQFDDQ